jgi:hypothetical protein
MPARQGTSPQIRRLDRKAVKYKLWLTPFTTLLLLGEIERASWELAMVTRHELLEHTPEELRPAGVGDGLIGDWGGAVRIGGVRATGKCPYGTWLAAISQQPSKDQLASTKTPKELA